jgi:NADH:ubiquinone oxidoreductase subunit 5 (subunit L)/multisubunit Na+/H+ antiporter MnhA subunit
VFRELTAVFSYLLIGHDATSRTSRRAAGQALIVTILDGLATLVGMIMLGERSGWPGAAGRRRPGAGTFHTALAETR